MHQKDLQIILQVLLYLFLHFAKILVQAGWCTWHKSKGYEDSCLPAPMTVQEHHERIHHKLIRNQKLLCTFLISCTIPKSGNSFTPEAILLHVQKFDEHPVLRFSIKGIYSVCSSDADGFLKGSACLADRGEGSVAPVFPGLHVFFAIRKTATSSSSLTLLSSPRAIHFQPRPGFIMDAIIIKHPAHKISLDFLMILLIRKRRFLSEHNHSIFLRERERESSELCIQN